MWVHTPSLAFALIIGIASNKMKLSYSQEPYTTLEQSNSMFQEIICSIQESLVK